MSFRVVLNSIIRYSVLPALSLDGVLHLDVIPGPYNAAAFNSFIDGLLDNMSPFPGSGSELETPSSSPCQCSSRSGSDAEAGTIGVIGESGATLREWCIQPEST
ncbi:hypothetical protein B0H13DRAFT_1624682 [Mycena leptocephala]|nr:hypothetical protein B0H13DRAFT_1624682 [Mycena leptocephala]